MSMTLEERAALVTFLQNFDTPTICNAIEMAQGRRGFDCFTHKTMFWTGKDEQRLVGFAATAKLLVLASPICLKGILERCDQSISGTWIRAQGRY